jgi:hypothetical protein
MFPVHAGERVGKGYTLGAATGAGKQGSYVTHGCCKEKKKKSLLDFTIEDSVSDDAPPPQQAWSTP